MPRKRPMKIEPTPTRAPDQTTITNCTFISGEAGKPPSPDQCVAVQRLAEAIIECARVLRGTQPGVHHSPAVYIGSRDDT